MLSRRWQGSATCTVVTEGAHEGYAVATSGLRVMRRSSLRAVKIRPRAGSGRA